MIYLDNAATTLQKPPEVAEAVVRALGSLGNPGRGAHRGALDAARSVYTARETLTGFFGGKNPERLAFTANATEALNIAIRGLFRPGDHLISTVCEHNSVLRPLYLLEKEGIETTFVPADRQGLLDYDALERAVRPNTRAVILTHASNLTGNLTDLERVAAVTRRHGLLLVVDASQTAGAVPIDVEKMSIDILCFTGHKSLLGPQGTGGLYVREGVEIRPFKVGGSGIRSYDRAHPAQMPTALEAGTLNTHGIAGLCAAVGWLQRTGVENVRAHEQRLVRRFVDGVSGLPGIKLYGNPDLSRRVGIVSLNIGTLDSAEVSDWLYEDYGICVRAGAHCAPRMHEALGTVGQGAVRFSFSCFTTEEEVDQAITALREIAEDGAG
jgi:cysteine desulfurase family protein